MSGNEATKEIEEFYREYLSDYDKHYESTWGSGKSFFNRFTKDEELQTLEDRFVRFYEGIQARVNKLVRDGRFTISDLKAHATKIELFIDVEVFGRLDYLTSAGAVVPLIGDPVGGVEGIRLNLYARSRKSYCAFVRSLEAETEASASVAKNGQVETSGPSAKLPSSALDQAK